MVSEALDSLTSQAVKLFRGARKRCVKRQTPALRE